MSHFRKFPTDVCLLIVLVIASAIPLAAQNKRAKDQPRFAGLRREPPSPPSCAQTGKIINMLVIGDSIMWGQGLKEDKKISYRVQDWLCTQTRRPVKLWREAHSGAVLKMGEPPEQASASPSLEEPAAAPNAMELDGEINVGEPTIPAQLDHALTHLKGPDVDFVLMDGCINDFDVFKILDPTLTSEQVNKRARAVCYDRMKPFLDDAAKRMPNARFIVTGYYPVITLESSKNVLFRFIFGRALAKEKQKWLFPNAKKNLFQNLTRLSHEFGEFTNNYLQQSVSEASGATGRIVFAQIYNKPDSQFGLPGSGFAAPKKTSLLWTSLFNSTGRGSLSKFFYVVFVLNFHAFRPNDQVYFDRKGVCKEANKGLVCRLAAFGHPNTKGVDEYVKRVTSELRQLMDGNDWLRNEQFQ
jgi:hypothetical protein